MGPFLLSFLLLITGQNLLANKPSSQVSKSELLGYFQGQDLYKDCFTGSEPKFHIQRIGYADLCSDGRPVAMVTAYSCNTHTGGSDINAVFQKDTKGQIRELTVENIQYFKGKPIFGDSGNSRKGVISFSNKGRTLIKTYEPETESSPMKIQLFYKWNGQLFKLINVRTQESAP